MDFDRYFTIHEQDLRDADESSGDWDTPGDASHETNPPTCRLKICVEDSLTEYISSLHSNRHHEHMDEHLMKPLPPVPEEPETGLLPLLASQETAPLQRRPRVGRTRITDTDDRRTSSVGSSTMQHSASPQTKQHLSLWPKAHAVDMNTTGRTSAVLLQRHIDNSYHADFESPHSKESCDLDQWANDIYGPQGNAMTSLRDKRRGVSPKSPMVDQHREPMPTPPKSRLSKSYQESTYCSSTSASSYTDHERASSYSASDILADYSERGRSEDTEATSFFDSDDSDEEPKSTAEKRVPAKKLWRKMASSLRPSKSKTSLRRSGMPPIDVPMILT